ncbi:hypothetical protein ABZP36_032142 [Zizania latifolia]
MPMAPSCTLLFLFLLPFLAAVTTSAEVAPGPAPQLNITGILDKGGQYGTLLRLLNVTHVDEQLSSQLKYSYDGITFFVPTDAAFSKLKAGTLNGLTDQQQVQLMLYHILPRYYSLSTFQTASNPLRTQASGAGGVYTVNVTSTTGQSMVNVSTGVATVPVGTTLYAEFPLAVYSVDDVLLPEQMFGKSKAPAPAPTPAWKTKERKKGGAVPKNDVTAAATPTAGTTSSNDSTDVAAAAPEGACVRWWDVIGAITLVGFANLVVA